METTAEVCVTMDGTLSRNIAENNEKDASKQGVNIVRHQLFSINLFIFGPFQTKIARL